MVSSSTGEMFTMSRPLHAFLLNIPLLTLFLTLTAANSEHYNPSRCKAIPGTAGWPSTESWVRLNESTGGRLLQPSPPGAVCHPGRPTYNATDCARVRTGWFTYEFHQADPVSTDWNQWNNDSCLPEPSYPCSGQGYPVFVINATTAHHVKLGVDFARKHNVRMVVKSSGHDFLGRSVAPNSLSIWVHHIKGLQPHGSFLPKKCKVTIDSTVVTVGGGSQMMELYSTLDALNQTVVGGGGKTVSVGGYLTGGGHGLLAPRYGLAADQVLEMEVVTPTGEIVTANECQNRDLFWSMRGGGGSTFGILTSATIKTFPSPKLLHLELVIATTDTKNLTIFDMVAYFLSQFPSLGDQGLSGYSFFFSAIPNPLDGGATTVGGLLMSAVLQDTSDPTALNDLMAPVLTHIATTWPNQFLILNQTTAYPSFYAWYQKNYDTSSAGTNSFTGSRLLDARALTANLTLNAQVFKRFSGSGIGTAYLISGKGVHSAEPRGGGNAVCPAWRKAYVHATFGVGFPPLNATARNDALDRINYYLEPMREQLAPGSGAYVNEANPEEPDWQHQFWGNNYDRLVRIKRRIDPDDVLWCSPCVGNERWREEDGGNQLCRVPQ
ncbi:hypothetical protein B0H66DRAFT_63722 [Apodospora peruviana]|uniref:FAD-binding PCMH-type domain-containing protein n=1 Tax=Apodospora peruviana TaxID=516989 RepID=A0AAE0IT55_9PEZI|nr:hypothetical protein B0H66DRAFT_63722 [Apodospora peruviana]